MDWNHIGLRQVTNKYVRLHYFDIVRGKSISTEQKNESAEELNKALKVLHNQLGGKTDFIAGSHPTIADLVMCSDLQSLMFLYPKGSKNPMIDLGGSLIEKWHSKLAEQIPSVTEVEA